MVKHPLRLLFAKSVFIFFIHFIFLAVLVSHPSFPVQSAWVPVLFQSGYTRGCCSSLQMTDRRWLWLFIALMSVLLPSQRKQKGQSCPVNTDLRSPPSSADWSLCFSEGSDARSVLEGNSSLRSGLR